MNRIQVFLYFLFLYLLFLSTYSIAQSDSSGVYLNSTDFQKNKLIYACDCKKEKHSIKLGSLFNYHHIIITQGRQRHKLSKADVFGYRDCNKKSYRFHIDKEYRIVSTLKIYMYFTEDEFGTGKNASIEDRFFFSVLLDSDIIPLTTENLKAAYPRNEKFHDLLDSSFRSEAELSTFDKYLKKYKLVNIFEESLK